MKPFLYFVLFFFTGLAVAQERVPVSGEINVPEGSNAEGMVILNYNTGKSIVSNPAGLFTINVRKGDTLTFNSLQFQDFSVVIDQGVIDNRELNVFVSEAVNELPEVVVRPYDLSGNVRVDVNIIPVQQIDLPTQSAAEINPYNREFRPDSLVSPQSPAMREGMIYSGGVDFANIFRHIFTTRNVKNNVGEDEDLQEHLLMLHNDDFFEEHLNIKEENIMEFILFTEDNGLTPEMLKPENEMDLIEFLVAQSQKYKQMKARQ